MVSLGHLQQTHHSPPTHSLTHDPALSSFFPSNSSVLPPHPQLCGHLPFYNRNHEVLFDLIMHEDIRLPDHLSPSAKDILTKLLDKNPNTRLGGGAGDSKELMNHPFFEPIDFQKLYDKQIPVPFVPVVSAPVSCGLRIEALDGACFLLVRRCCLNPLSFAFRHNL